MTTVTLVCSDGLFALFDLSEHGLSAIPAEIRAHTDTLYTLKVLTTVKSNCNVLLDYDNVYSG